VLDLDSVGKLVRDDIETNAQRQRVELKVLALSKLPVSRGCCWPLTSLFSQEKHPRERACGRKGGPIRNTSGQKLSLEPQHQLTRTSPGPGARPVGVQNFPYERFRQNACWQLSQRVVITNGTDLAKPARAAGGAVRKQAIARAVSPPHPRAHHPWEGRISSGPRPSTAKLVAPARLGGG